MCNTLGYSSVEERGEGDCRGEEVSVERKEKSQRIAREEGVG